MSTYVELKAQAQELLRQAEALRSDERKGVIAELKAKISEYGLSENDLFSSSKAKSAVKREVQPKYRGPNGELWTGRGRAPNWMAVLLASGHKKEEFAI